MHETFLNKKNILHIRNKYALAQNDISYLVYESVIHLYNLLTGKVFR